MDPIFEHPVFDSAMEKVKRVIRHFEKPQEKFENSLYTCFKVLEQQCIFHCKTGQVGRRGNISIQRMP